METRDGGASCDAVAIGCDVASLRRICQEVAPPGRKTQGFARGASVFVPCFLPQHHYDEVFPNVLLGDNFLATNPQKCKEFDVTHVLNAAQGVKFGNVNTDESLFQPFGIKFMGVRAQDNQQFDLSAHFQEAADFIHQGLARNAATGSGKVLVHCVQGISRSTSLLCAYLMIKQGLSAEQSLTTIRLKREVLPNHGFLKQLCQLDADLHKKSK